MKIKKIILCSVFAFLSAVAVLFVGCSGRHTVTVNKMFGGEAEGAFTLTVADGEGVVFGILAEEYPGEFASDTGFWSDDFFYTDEDCTVKYTDEAVTDDITLYYGIYNPAVTRRIVFVYGGGEYVIYRAEDAQLSSRDFAVSAYGYGRAEDYEYFLDENKNSPVDITQLSLEGEGWHEVTIYVFDA